MTSWKRVAALTGCSLLVMVLAPILGGLLLGGLFVLASERTIYGRAVSPDGNIEARVQFDDGGAMTSWSKIVLLRASWVPSDSAWLSCRAFWGDGTDRIRLKWINNSTLSVSHGFKETDVQEVVDECGAVRIHAKFDPRLVSDQP